MNDLYKIVWSIQAETSYLKILEYLIDNWTLKTAISFEKKVEDYLKILQKNPQMCKSSEIMLNIRKCIITTQTSLAYRIVNNSIELITFFDNRNNHHF